MSDNWRNMVKLGTMDDNDKIYHIVRQVFNKWAKRLEGLPDFGGYCGDISQDLVSELRKNGIYAEVVKFVCLNRNKQNSLHYPQNGNTFGAHVIVKLKDNRYFDLTANQYGLESIVQMYLPDAYKKRLQY